MDLLRTYKQTNSNKIFRLKYQMIMEMKRDEIKDIKYQRTKKGV